MISKDKLKTILKSKKAMVMFLLVGILLSISFYGSAYALSSFGICTGISTLEAWGNVFVMISIGVYAYIYIVLDDDMFSKKKSKKGNSNESDEVFDGGK